VQALGRLGRASGNGFRRRFEIGDKFAIGGAFIVVVLDAQQGRRVHGDEQSRAICHFERFAPEFGDRNGFPREASRGAYTEGDDRGWLDELALRVEPDPATFDFVIVRPFVQPAFASHLVLKMFHRIGDEGVLAGNSGISQCLIENPTRWTDERPAGEIFLVARLLAHKHERSVGRTLARHGLSRIAVERAPLACRLRFGKLAKAFDGSIGRFVHKGPNS